jgi:hypothetical protein
VEWRGALKDGAIIQAKPEMLCPRVRKIPALNFFSKFV